jgi:hypothetical protein
MPNIRSIMRTGIISITAILLVVSFPVTSFADDSSDGSSTTCTAPASSQKGVHVPVGSDAQTFTYQCSGQYSGDWTNQYYAYDPSTNTRTPIYPLNYSYNCTTGIWTMDSWDYDAATGAYNDDRIQTTAPVGIDTGCPVIAPSSSAAGSSDASSNPSDTGGSSTASGSDTTNDSSVDGNNTSGAGGSNTTTSNTNGTTYVNNGTTAVITNGINGDATSGDSLVAGNTTGGDATSGNVQDEADIINLLQSSSNALGTGNNVVTFTDNINGDVNGNLLLDPSTLATVQPASTNTNTANTNNTVVVNNSTGAQINNNIDLAANSGNATVSSNTTGGNATSGSAQAIANVVNLMDSAITAGKSFIGTININGNLTGNILVPANFVNELLADNVPTVNLTAPGSDNTNTTTTTNNTTVNNTNNEGIDNNVNATANSGQAAVSGNSSGGDATSGQATTNITAFNLTGSNVIGANDLLVFVNVLGSWVGMIMNAPAGTTAAELGGGITNDTTTNTSNTTVNNNVNQGINNDITGSAKSGSADVSNNTNGGNATSGNADTAVNLVNVEGSTISLNNWFGILFINVFGTWNGSFGVGSNTSSQSSSSSVESVTPSEASSILTHSPVFGSSITAGGGGDYSSSAGTTTADTAAASTSSNPGTKSLTTGSVLADKTVKTLGTAQAQAANRSSSLEKFVIVGSLVAVFIIGDAFVSHRKRVKSIIKYN